MSQPKQPINESDFVNKFEKEFGWKPTLDNQNGNLVIKGAQYDTTKKMITPPHSH